MSPAAGRDGPVCHPDVDWQPAAPAALSVRVLGARPERLARVSERQVLAVQVSGQRVPAEQVFAVLAANRGDPDAGLASDLDSGLADPGVNPAAADVGPDAGPVASAPAVSVRPEEPAVQPAARLARERLEAASVSAVAVPRAAAFVDADVSRLAVAEEQAVQQQAEVAVPVVLRLAAVVLSAQERRPEARPSEPVSHPELASSPDRPVLAPALAAVACLLRLPRQAQSRSTQIWLRWPGE